MAFWSTLSMQGSCSKKVGSISIAACMHTAYKHLLTYANSVHKSQGVPEMLQDETCRSLSWRFQYCLGLWLSGSQSNFMCMMLLCNCRGLVSPGREWTRESYHCNAQGHAQGCGGRNL